MSLDSYPSELLDIDFLTTNLYNFIHSRGKKQMLPDINYNKIDDTDFKLVLNSKQQTAIVNNTITNPNVNI